MENEFPAWDKPVTLSVSPGDIINVLFATAASVHTGWTSCIEQSLTVSDISAMDDRSGNYARLAEQEFTDEEQAGVNWHDWTVEILLGNVFITGHWQVQVTASPLDWEWCAREAEAAFEKAALLVGRRVGRTMMVEAGTNVPQPRERHH